MKKIKLKICGLKYPENIQEVAALQPDYMGFIFYERSKRNFTGEIPEISKKIKKTGVFVDSEVDYILEKVIRYNLRAIQLHGNESVNFCKELREKTDAEVIKVFSVGDDFELSVLNVYEPVCDYFLFDTQGREKGGNGKTFDWELLKNYTEEKPFLLSGGIGLEEVDALKDFFKTKASEFCYALDVNSRFEDKPGFKNLKKLELFIKDLNIKR